MASTLKFDSERRAMRRERHDARVARKRERQEARELKHAHQLDAVGASRVTVEGVVAEARERTERMGEERAVADALGALAHSGATPWHRHRERLADAMSTGRIPPAGACARRAC